MYAPVNEVHTGMRSVQTPDSNSSSEGDLNVPPRKRLNEIYRKLDRYILPPLVTTHFFITLLGGAYGNSLTMNFEAGHDLKTYIGASTHQLSVANALGFVGYIVFDVLMNLIMSRVSPGLWLARLTVTTGLTYTCYAAIHTPQGLIALRFFTGMASAGIWPGMAYYISMYYPGRRMTSRIGYYFIPASLSGVIADLTAAGFQKMDGNHNYTGWQWMMIIYGSVTLVVGICLCFWLPGVPPALQRKKGKSWLRKIDSCFCSYRIPLNPQEQTDHGRDMAMYSRGPVHWDLKQLFKVLVDPLLWPFIFMYFGNVGVGSGIGTFGTTILKSQNSNLTSIHLSLLIAPIWLFNCAGIIIITTLTDRFNHLRGRFFIISNAIVIVGFMVATYAKDSWSRLGGLYICGFGLGPSIPIIMGWCTNLLSLRHGTIGAAAAPALASGVGNLGSVAVSYSLYAGWPEDADRFYRDSNMVLVALLGMGCMACLCAIFLEKTLATKSSSWVRELDETPHTQELPPGPSTDDPVRAQVQDSGRNNKEPAYKSVES